MTIVHVADFAPDMPNLSATTDVASNVIPISAESYGPVQAPAVPTTPTNIGQAQPGQVIGAITCAETTSGDGAMFAGTANTCNEYWSGSWFPITPVGFAGGATRWRFAQFKDRIIAVPGSALHGTPVQAGQISVNAPLTNAATSGTAPSADFVAVIRNFVMVASTWDSVGGTAPYRQWWSAQDDYSNWPTPGSDEAQQTLSDFNDLAGDWGAERGLVSGVTGADGLLFFERAVFNIVYTGPPDVFDFIFASAVRGCCAADSIVKLGGTSFYLGEDGFYSYDGSTQNPIGADRVDRWLLGTNKGGNGYLNGAYLANVIGAADDTTKTVAWAFPSINSTSGLPDTVLFYSWLLNKWGIASINLEWLFSPLNFVAPSTSQPEFRRTLGCFDTSHRFNWFTGSNLQAQLGSQMAQLFPSQKAWIQSVRPLVDGGSPTVAISTTDELEVPEVFGADVAMNSIGECPQRATGRYCRARITVPAAASWNHIRGFDVTAIPAGMR